MNVPDMNEIRIEIARTIVRYYNDPRTRQMINTIVDVIDTETTDRDKLKDAVNLLAEIIRDNEPIGYWQK